MATIEDSIRLQLERATSHEMASHEMASHEMASHEIASHEVTSHDPALSPHTATSNASARRISRTTAEDPACLQRLGADTCILVGNTGDNPLVQQLLVQAYQSPLADDFQSRLDEPLYEPSDRLLLQRAEKLIGHVQVSKLIGWFHGQRCPLARLQDFITLPEYRGSDFDTPLLELAESVAINEGAILGFVRTDRPEWFEQRGWSSCRGQGHTRANTRAILSHMDAQQSKRSHHSPQIEVRTWRHFELDSILKLYQQLSTNMWGTLQRSLETWQWLVGRKAHDQILIAIEKIPGQELTGDNEKAPEIDISNPPNVVGYAIVRDSCIVEMLTLPGHSAVRSSLLVQACRDAIDRDHHFVSLHTPAADPMHELLVTAGGSWIADSAATGGQWMLKLLAPERWIERLYPLLHERAREAGIQRPLEIDFAVGEKSRLFTLTRRSSRLETCSRSPAAIQCDWRGFQDLLTSNLTYPEAIAQGRLRTPHLSLLRTLAALFPPKLFWQSPLPLLRL